MASRAKSVGRSRDGVTLLEATEVPLKRLTAVSIVMMVALGTTPLLAQNAQAEKTIIANERAINEAVARGNLAAFKQHVAADAWSMDGMMGPMPVADFIRDFEAMTKDMKLSSWDLTDSRIQWVDANRAIHTYKWTGAGTYRGELIPSPVWTSTVWTRKDGRWIAVFHQESASLPAPKAK